MPEFYHRYIDDIVGATSMSRVDLDQFIDYVCNFHPAFQFTFVVSEREIEFLDIKISVCRKKLSTLVHYKATDSHSYLRYGSCHPKACKNAIPYSQFLRLRLCSEDNDFVSKVNEMENFFLVRDYPQKVIDKAKTSVIGINRAQAPQERPKGVNTEIIILGITFNSHSQMIKNIIERNFHILQLDDEVGYLFQEKPLVSYRRDRNVKDMLVHSKIGVNSKVGKTLKCGLTRCFTCPHVFDDVHQVRGPRGVYSPKDNFSCISKDVIYYIECLKCGSLYIGETGDRIREHLRDIKTKQP